MTKRREFLELLSNPRELENLLSPQFCKELSLELSHANLTAIGLFFRNLKLLNIDNHTKCLSLKIIAKNFPIFSINLYELVGLKDFDIKLLPSFLKIIIDEKIKRDGFPSMIKMLEENVILIIYLKLSRLGLKKEFLEVFDEYITEKPIPEKFLFSNSRKVGKSYSPTSRFSLDAAFKGNPWKASCSLTPSSKDRQKKIILQKSLFSQQSSHQSVSRLKTQIARLIAEGFSVAVFEDNKLKILNNIDDLNIENIQTLAPQDAHKILAKNLITADESIILDGENANILDGVFFHSLDSIDVRKNYLRALFNKNHQAFLANDDDLNHLARNSKTLKDPSKLNQLLNILDPQAPEDSRKVALLSEIFLSASFIGNQEVLELTLQKIEATVNPNKNYDAFMLSIFPLQCEASLVFPIIKSNISRHRFLNSLIYFAVINRDMDSAGFLINHIKQLNTAKKEQLLSYFLMIAAYEGILEILEIIFQQFKQGDININHQNEDGYSALILATEKRYQKTVEILLRREDININQQNKDGDSALTIAAKRVYQEIVEILLKQKDIDINQPNENGYSALIIAASMGHKEIVEILLKQEGININQQNEDGYSALIIAASMGHKEIVEILLKQEGININQQNEDGYSALIIAAKKGHQEIVEILLKQEGININQPNENGYSALIIAASMGHKEIVEILLKQEGININQQNADGYSALKLAAEREHQEIVKILLKQKGIDTRGINIANVLRAKNGLFFAQDTSNLVKYDSNSQTFEMSQVGEFLNLENISANPKIEAGIFDSIEKGEFRKKSPPKFTILNSSEIRSFDDDTIQSMKREKDVGYASFTLSAKKNQQLKLLGVNYPYQLAAIRTNPSSARINSLKIDSDGFYYVTTSQECRVEYVMEFDYRAVEIENPAVDFINEYRESCNRDTKLPDKESFKIHAAFLEAVYNSESIHTSCGLRVEVALHMMNVKGIDCANIKICQINGNHVALKFVENESKQTKYLELGGIEGVLNYQEPEKPTSSWYQSFFNLFQISTNSHRDDSTSHDSAAQDFNTATTSQSSTSTTNPKKLAVAENLLPKKVDEENLRQEISAQTLLSWARRTPKPLTNNQDLISALDSAKSPTLVISDNTQSLANQIAKNLTQKYRIDLKPPIFILSGPELLDIGQSKFKITADGEVFFSAQGFLADFLNRAQSFNDALKREDEIIGADIKTFSPTLIIDWSKFSAKQRVALNSLIDQHPILNNQSLDGIKIIGVNNSLTKDSSFLSRHQEIYEIKEQDLSPLSQDLEMQKTVAKTSTDLQGFDDWKSTLFGEVILQNNQPIWLKSDFTKQLEASANEGFLENIEIINSSNSEELQEFINRGYALGYLEYQGFRVNLPDNVFLTVSKSPFNYSALNLEKHKIYKECLLQKTPNCPIINSQLFDQLLFTPKIKDGIYSEEAGLIEKARNQTLQLVISSNLTKAQLYVLFSQAQKYNVALELYLAPSILLPAGLENLQSSILKEQSSVLEDRKIKSAIVLTKNSRAIIEEILQDERQNPTTLEKNKNILVINVEDFSYQDLVSKTSYEINDDGSLSNFREIKSHFISALENGERIILKGEFSLELLEMLQPILLNPWAQNLMLIIENPHKEIPSSYLEFLEIDKEIEMEEKHPKAPLIKEEFSQDISSKDFLNQRHKLFASAIEQNQIIHLTGISGIGKSTLVQQFATQNNLKLYSGLESVKDFTQDQSGSTMLLIDEMNIEDYNFTFLEELKNGETRILYKGEILTLGENHKIVFASNPLEYGSGRNLQKLFSDDRIAKLELNLMPTSYIMEILTRDIFDKCTIEDKVDFKSFEKFCQTKITEYNKSLTSPNPLTIRELQQEALLYLAEKSQGALKYKKLKTPNFVSTPQTRELEEQILAAINVMIFQKEGKLPQTGTPGMLLQGLPGIGKSVILETYLTQYLGPKSFIKVSGSLEEKKLLIDEAFEKGIPIIIEEIDASIADGLEKYLNLALSNVHPNEAKQKEVAEGRLEIKQGFALFASANGTEHGQEGRDIISPAIYHRLATPKLSALEDIKEVDICEIIESWGIVKDNIAELSKAFVKARAEDPFYNIRDLKSFCNRSDYPRPLISSKELQKLSIGLANSASMA